MAAPQPPPTCRMKGVAKNMATATRVSDDEVLEVDQQEEESEAVRYPLKVEYCGGKSEIILKFY